MGIAYDSSDLARNEVLIGVLSKLSPTDIIKSTVIGYFPVTLSC